ncbi:2-oxo acid dehydrogenase subunit E2 [Janibacter hoylei]|uniref:2-oxo acid dehydrogenase subunit E2 n=1 Tax=Janibacter hoylei TaxID=364298 RepID=UPI002490B6FE|nr:2-oxo acid dehydrogenase subunit E2 [Janibacter hoylei]
MSVAGLARKFVDVAQRTRDNRNGPDELTGGTFTLSNTGRPWSLVRHLHPQPAPGRDPRDRRRGRAAGRHP